MIKELFSDELKLFDLELNRYGDIKSESEDKIEFKISSDENFYRVMQMLDDCDKLDAEDEPTDVEGKNPLTTSSRDMNFVYNYTYEDKLSMRLVGDFEKNKYVLKIEVI